MFVLGSRKNKGFSLLEVLLSISILTVLAVNVMGVMSHVKRGSVGTNDKTQAMLILERKMLEIRAEYSRAGTVSGAVSKVAEFFNADLLVETKGMDGAADDAETGLKKVVLTLRWQNHSNVQKSASLSGLMFRG